VILEGKQGEMEVNGWNSRDLILSFQYAYNDGKKIGLSSKIIFNVGL
jgi:hypothetical protein